MRLALLFSRLLLFASAAQAADEGPKCADLVVIGKILKYDPDPLPDLGEDTIVITWSWHLNIEVEEVLLGNPPPKKMRVIAYLHTDYRDDIEHFVMYFKHEPEGYVLDRGRLSVAIVRDRAGRLVLPFAEPPSNDELLPDGWIARDYEKRLRPLYFSHHGIWWMKSETAEGSLVNDEDLLKAYNSKSDWLTMQDGWVVPKRGITTADLKAMIRETTPRCPRAK